MTEPAVSIRFKQQALNEVLQEICREEQVTAAIIANREGFLIAAASATYDAETIAALVAYLRDTAQRAQVQLGLALLDEVAIRDRAHRVLVCRSFPVDGEDDLLLVVMMPTCGAYRRLTNIAIRRIREVWQAGS